MCKAMRFFFIAVMSLTISTVVDAGDGVYRASFSAGAQHLLIELLDDDLAHFQVSAAHQEAIWTTPMVAKTDYTGPSSVNLIAPNILETPDMRLEIDENLLCITITDLTREPDLLLTTMCPTLIEGEASSLSFTQEGTTDLYGLGEQFQRRGGTEGNWIGRRRFTLNLYGNELTSFNGGNVGNAQFPILYALGTGTDNYALFLDDVYQQYWDFSADPFSAATSNSILRWYVMTGSDLPDLRGDYMELTGRPPVPARQMFGLWVSEYGYENWDELNTVLASLRAENFPVDGFMLDLQWFGGIGENSQMGSLTWDETNFPDPANFIATLRAEHGAGVMVIEEPYVTSTSATYAESAEQGALVRQCAEVESELIALNAWWGAGGMVDWTNPTAAAWWHDNRRQHLIDTGVIGHWTDLGEPENYDENGWYYGFPEFDLHSHADIHNIYNLMWSQSIWDGYQRNSVDRRPFILSRSGTSGSQRYGVAMWSGDIAANMSSLEAHMNVQMHMSLSGIDYFGADVGGFNRQVFDPVLGEEGMYSVWLANAVLLDVPLRPHAQNLQNLDDTAPSLIGDIPSNLTNVRLRYKLSPYLYTLAHRAYRDGQPLFAPLVYYFQDDLNIRTLGSQKMLGLDLMMATLTGYELERLPVYLPAGGWFNYYTNEYFESAGEWIDVPTTIDDVLRAPLFVRDGAIIPQMRVDDQTLNMLGQRLDGSTANDLIVSVYQHTVESGSFTLIEDDGETMAYQTGDVRETQISFTLQDNGWLVEVGAATGTYTGALEQRNVEVRLITSGQQVTSVMLNDQTLNTPESGLVDVTTPLAFLFMP